MKILSDPNRTLANGLAAIRSELQVPTTFPAEVLAAADAAARRTPGAHIDRTNIAFITLDPASSTDLDQAFSIEASGGDLLLHYAIADVAWFVDDGGPIDLEAWRRGETLYFPDEKVGLYPPILSEDAASLLPDGPRPAVVFTVRVHVDGSVDLEGAERALVRSTAKLAYDNVQDSDLPPGFAELARRIEAAEEMRGTARVDPPEQEVTAGPEGGFELMFRPRLRSEASNAALSLATNLAVAQALQSHHTGLFRVMAEPDDRAVARLRRTAEALGVAWPETTPLGSFERTLDQHDPRHAALMLAIRRAGPGASYTPYQDGVIPWHAAMAATYAHATAPLRRLADRYVVRAALEIANGRPVPEIVSQAFVKLPAVMARADALAGRIDSAVVDLAEAVLLSGKEDVLFRAVVIEVAGRAAKIQLCDFPVVARISVSGVEPGDSLRVRLIAADTTSRTIIFGDAGLEA